MQHEISMMDDKVFVKLSGSIHEDDALVIKELLTQYIENGHASFVIDFSLVDYIDSAGLGAMVTIKKRSAMRNGGVIIQGLAGIVKELFVLTRVEKVFEIR